MSTFLKIFSFKEKEINTQENKTFTEEKENLIRAFDDTNGEPILVAKDVAVALGYRNTGSAISDHCKYTITVQDFRKEILTKLNSKKNQGLGNQGALGAVLQEIKDLHPQTLLIREPDLYALINGSKLESAERFKLWIYSEVLPSIRKTGSYLLNQNNNFVTKTDLDNFVTKDDLNSLLSVLNIIAENTSVKVSFANHYEKKMESAYDLDSVVAKIKEINPAFRKISSLTLKTEINNFLRHNGLVSKITTLPTGRGIEAGLGLEVLPLIYRPDDDVGKSIKTVIYTKYLDSFIDKFIQFKITQNAVNKMLLVHDNLSDASYIDSDKLENHIVINTSSATIN